MTQSGARRLLLHICCAPCLAGPLGVVREEGFEVEGYFYNPNIHPLLEFRRRIKALKVFCESDPLEVHISEDYGLMHFIEAVWTLGAKADGRRCRVCYELRLAAAARKAREIGASAFTTTLLVSRHQKHDLVREVAEQVAAREGVDFLYRDFRPLQPVSDEAAEKQHLYRQPYCGCIFSEELRYRNTTKHLYRTGSEESGREPSDHHRSE